jgi:hypothetical protein
MKGTSYEAPHYEVFSNPLPLLPSQIQILYVFLRPEIVSPRLTPKLVGHRLSVVGDFDLYISLQKILDV